MHFHIKTSVNKNEMQCTVIEQEILTKILLN